MKRPLILLLCCLLYSMNLYSQEYCEIDQAFTNFDRQLGLRINQTSDSNILVLSISGQNGNMKVLTPQFVLIKMDKCGKIVWSYSYANCYGCSAAASILMEDDDGSIIFGGSMDKNLPNKRELRLFKTNSSGQLIWGIQFGDSAKNYEYINGFKVSQNRFLFVGSIVSNTNSTIIYPTVLMVDTLGNTLYEEDFPAQEGRFYSSYKLNNNNLLLLGSNKSSNFIIMNIDTIGNIIRSTNIPWLRGMNPYLLLLNNELKKVIYVAKSSTNQTLIAKLDLDGNVIRDSLFNQIIANNHLSFHITPKNDILLYGKNYYLLDSSFNLKWVDENIDAQGFPYSTIVTKDETMVSTGRGNWHFYGSNNVVYDLWFGSKSISTIAKTIYLQGRDIINIKHDTLQVSASVLPSTTINKTVLWVVNDTNLASISQTGLVRAKANGAVTVTASTTDGSNLSAQKVITITNQSVGLEANAQLLQNLRVYPNPAKDYFEIDDSGSELKSLEILDLSGSVLQTFDAGNCNSPCTYSTKELSNGIYFLRIHSSHGVVVKKFAVYR